MTALAAGSNVDLLEQQIREFHPHTAVLYDEQRAEELRLRVKDLEVQVLSGPEGLIEAASEPVLFAGRHCSRRDDRHKADDGCYKGKERHRSRK